MKQPKLWISRLLAIAFAGVALWVVLPNHILKLAIPLACVLSGLVAGYMLGWQRGHLLGVRWAIMIQMDSEAEIPEAVMEYVRRTMNRVRPELEEKYKDNGVWQELMDDAEFQQQLWEQSGG